MKSAFVLFLFLVLILSACASQESKEETVENVEMAGEMKITSSAFVNGGKIPSKYTCDGNDLIVPLQISDVPAGAKSLALIMDDPDAIKPAGKVWDHWVVFNIPVDVKEIAEGEEPSGTGGRNSWGRTGYGGPCPPDGEHRYYFKLYALDAVLSLPEGSTKAEIERAMQGHVAAKAELMGRYERVR